MKGLLYKEFYLFRFSFLFLLFVQLLVSGVCIAISVLSTEAGDEMPLLYTICYATMFFVVSFLNTEVFKRDENAVWCSFVASTPPAARGQIQSKYYLLLLLNLIVLFFTFLTDTVVVAIEKDLSVSVASNCALLFCLQLILSAVETPFIVRFGAQRGMLIKGALLGVLFSAFGIYLLFGDLTFFLGEDPVGDIYRYLTGGKMIWVTALTPFVAVFLYYLSYQISVRVYRKGAENYEE